MKKVFFSLAFVFCCVACFSTSAAASVLYPPFAAQQVENPQLDPGANQWNHRGDDDEGINPRVV